MKKVAIVTGASSGMGREFVNTIDKRFSSIDEIWLISRRRDKLEEVRAEVNKPCLIIDEDISEAAFYYRFQKILRQESPNVKMLINAAGFGMVGEFDDIASEVLMGMVNTNCMGLTGMISLVIPYMCENSRIINFASSAAFMPQPGFSVYAATKSYVLSLSRALNRELEKKGIYVTAVCPGPVATEFFTIAESGKKRAWFKDVFMANKTDVVNQALSDSINKKELSVYGMPMKLFMVMTKVLPHRLLLFFYKFLLK